MVTAERNLKKRYEIKNEMNKYYHELDLKKQDKEMNKYNNNKEEESFKSKNKIKNINDDWQKILHCAGKNNTFKTKSIYKDPYEHSDVNKLYDKFKLVRNKTLEALPRIEKDENFYQKKRISKCGSYREINKNVLKIRNEFDKDKFFNRQPKDINLAKIKCLNTAKNLRKRDKEFLMNKEKNEKRLQSNSLTFETQADNRK